MKTVKDFPTFELSPFKPTGLKLVSTRSKTINVYDKDTAEVLENKKTISEQIIADDKEYRKIFIEGLDFIKLLSTPGLKLFCYILMSLKPKKDFVILDKEKIMEYCGYKSRSSYYDAVSELLDKNIIARQVGTDSLYFINVNYFFNGTRVDLLETNEIFKNEQ